MSGHWPTPAEVIEFFRREWAKLGLGEIPPAFRRTPDPLDCPKGRHVYEVPSVYPSGVPMPGTPGIVSVRDCHCPAASPGHIHWTKID